MNTFEDIMNAREAISTKLRVETDRETAKTIAGELTDLTNLAYERFPEEMGNHRREMARKIVANS